MTLGSKTKTAIILLSGIATAAITPFVETILSGLLNHDIYTFMTVLVLPAGAYSTGLVSASGFYLSAYLLHQMPNRYLFLMMVLASLLTPILIYFIDYSSLTLDNGTPVDQAVSFPAFVEFSITHATYSFGRYGIGPSSGPVGSFGYWIAADQLLGFLLGGVSIYVFLAQIPRCSDCRMYMKTFGSKTKVFQSEEPFAVYYDNLFKISVYSPEFIEAINMDIGPDLIAKPKKGYISLVESLVTCESCGNQHIKNVVSVRGDKEWREVNKLTRNVTIPYDVQLRHLFAKNKKVKPIPPRGLTTGASDDTSKPKKEARFHWLMWWRVSPQELDKQIANYHTLRFYQSARGLSLLCLLLSTLISLALGYSNGNIYDAIPDEIAFVVLGVLIYFGFKWASFLTMIFWTVEKLYQIYIILSSGSNGGGVVGIFFWWTAFMQVFYLAFMVERARKLKVNLPV
jgi:hypothetical protein